MARTQKIKPKYQKYASLMFIILVAVIFYFLYIFYINKGFESFASVKPESKGGGFGKPVDKSYQPGDERSNFPGKLKWGRDF